MNNQNIGIFIKKLREEKNITQQELADKLHISRQAVSKWELGKAMPDYTILVILSELFNVTIDELIMGEKNPKENVSLKLYKEKNKLDKLIF